MADLLILAHGGSWDFRFQVTSLAASAAAVGDEVEIALFFGALDAWVSGNWSAYDPRPPVTPERLESLDLPPLAEMLAAGREAGRIRLYACSASARFLDLELSRVQSAVDAILGWPSVYKRIRGTARVVTF